MLIKRRIDVLTQLIEEFKLSVRVVFVKSEMNKGDELTRVKRSWREVFERILEVDETELVGAVQPGWNQEENPGSRYHQMLGK